MAVSGVQLSRSTTAHPGPCGWAEETAPFLEPSGVCGPHGPIAPQPAPHLVGVVLQAQRHSSHGLLVTAGSGQGPDCRVGGPQQAVWGDGAT